MVVDLLYRGSSFHNDRLYIICPFTITDPQVYFSFWILTGRESSLLTVGSFWCAEMWNIQANGWWRGSSHIWCILRSSSAVDIKLLHIQSGIPISFAKKHWLLYRRSSWIFWMNYRLQEPSSLSSINLTMRILVCRRPIPLVIADLWH